ncbi:hypothetical protein [Rickettsia endosymbiont of Polydrusus tereticollis]|uniref:hypothetical protein n=1 Tax=Rickettsia endosymbiont of Polydrusus tereticollis TaxID=3066251 RepID=UPI003132DD3C
MTDKNKVDTSYYDAIIESNDLSRMNEVVKYCDEKLKLNPYDIVTLYRKSEALEALGEIEDAMEVLKKALVAVTKLSKEDKESV